MNGKEPFRPKAPVTWPQPRRGEEREKTSTSGFPAGRNRNGKRPTPFCKSLIIPKARLHEGMPSYQPIREHQFGFANLEKEAYRKNARAEHAASPSDIN